MNLLSVEAKPAVPHRDPRTGYWTVYQGGRHRIVCSGGEWHHQVNDDGRMIFEKSRCLDWVGGCPARALIAQAVAP